MIYGDNRDLDNVALPPDCEHMIKLMIFSRIVLKLLPPPAKVVDVGTRTGDMVEMLSKHGYDITGTDLVSEFVEYATANNRNVIFDDITDSSLPSNEFDVVLSRHCIEHTKSAELFFCECARVLKVGGTLMMLFPIEGTAQWSERKATGKHMLCFDNADDVRIAIEKSGLKVKALKHSKAYYIPSSDKDNEHMLIAKKVA